MTYSFCCSVDLKASDVCLEKFRDARGLATAALTAETAAPTPVAFRRKATGTHWLDFSLRRATPTPSVYTNYLK
ncbi:hypothetical protein [Nostoc sp. MG11]|uniref:hypothetical protein n=1 Tax=Nostoc sp. MG11 TaxID=2721166 RepID=UPI001865F49F|nr:hypothetical protein [Nostoc sp. MG11]